MVTLLARNTQVSRASLAELASPFRLAFQPPWLPQAWDWHAPAGLAALNAEVTAQASTIAYLNDFTIMMWIVILITPLLLLLRKPRPVTAEEAARRA